LIEGLVSRHGNDELWSSEEAEMLVLSYLLWRGVA
jgi:hypothetical protein